MLPIPLVSIAWIVTTVVLPTALGCDKQRDPVLFHLVTQAAWWRVVVYLWDRIGPKTEKFYACHRVVIAIDGGKYHFIAVSIGGNDLDGYRLGHPTGTAICDGIGEIWGGEFDSTTQTLKDAWSYPPLPSDAVISISPCPSAIGVNVMVSLDVLTDTNPKPLDDSTISYDSVSPSGSTATGVEILSLANHKIKPRPINLQLWRGIVGYYYVERIRNDTRAIAYRYGDLRRALRMGDYVQAHATGDSIVVRPTG